jgi:hypothetical protein
MEGSVIVNDLSTREGRASADAWCTVGQDQLGGDW